MLNVVISSHAREQLEERGITEDIVFSIIGNPQQTISQGSDKLIYQSLWYFEDEAKEFLVRVFVNIIKVPTWLSPFILPVRWKNIGEMKIKFDQEVDILVLRFTEEKILESDEIRPGVILDFDREGNIVQIEILDASKRMEAPFKLEYEVASA